nr:MAG TPA: hypothetical protein [Caudoviricetes sp.]
MHPASHQTIDAFSGKHFLNSVSLIIHLKYRLLSAMIQSTLCR